MKAVVVIDMPENCRLCPFRQSPWSFCLGEYEKEKHCPLRPLPSKRHIPITKTFGTPFNVGKAKGWNACLDAITGETE